VTLEEWRRDHYPQGGRRASQLYAAALAADTDAIDHIRAVRVAHGSTAPPPPWPQPAELVSARRELREFMAGLEPLADRGVVLKAEAADKLRAELVRRVRAVWQGRAALASYLEAGKSNQRQAVAAARAARDLLPSFSLGTLGWIVVLWAGYQVVTTARAARRLVS
jgi:hypothetical protein